jgi:heme A synthase
MRKITFPIYTLMVMGWNILVILWGALVRATGSGAGCGSHWPLCNGEVIPVAPQVETMIEFSHRLSSGLALLLVLGMVVWAWRAYPKGAAVRTGAGYSLFFIITEALVGAGLVLFAWVAHDESLGRVISMGVHLVNTFLLLGALTLTSWWAFGGARLHWRGAGARRWGLLLGLVGVLILGVSGAMTALGDTLFPAASLAEGWQQDFAAESHFLLRLRIWHPLIAVTVGMYLVFLSALLAMFDGGRTARRLAILVSGLFVIQLLAGIINLALLAPVWMQLVHLLLADLVWIALVLLTANALRVTAAPLPAAQADPQPAGFTL